MIYNLTFIGFIIHKNCHYILRFLRRTMEITSVGGQSNIKEGQAEILVSPNAKVFYNPVQEFNRDLSVAVLRLLTKKWMLQDKDASNIRILEALSATGLRSIRYAKEIPGIKEVVANDVSAFAIENIIKNVTHNGVEDIVKTSHKDACEIMFESRLYPKRFHAVDLDPYGCPSIFLDTAVQSVRDGGLLLVTCTDMAVLCGNTPNTCYVKYGAISLKNKACHEMALRIVLQTIESHATRYKRYIVPLLSVSADFYVRVFVQVFTGAAKCKETTSKLSMVYQCVGCDTMTLQPLGLFNESSAKRYTLPRVPPVSETCRHCDSKHLQGGPIWSAAIHDKTFVTELLDSILSSDFGTKNRLVGVLSVIKEELDDVPLYYTTDRLCNLVHVSSMSMLTMRSAILNAGYKVSFSHANKNSVKTDAPARFIWDVLRAWAEKNVVSEKTRENDTVASKILKTPCSTAIDFSIRSDANPLSRESKLVRFPENPPFWGPGCRAAVNVEKTTKKKRMQNKKQNSKRAKLSNIEDHKVIENETNKL